MKESENLVSRLRQMGLHWWVIGLAALVFLCVAVSLFSAWLVYDARRDRAEPPLLAAPATRTPTPAAPENPPAEPAPTVTLPAGPGEGAETVTAVRMLIPPQIDGDLSEWDGVPSFSTTAIVEQEASWNGTMDITPAWYIGWDGQNLYLAVAVVDDVHVQINETRLAYRGDSLELQLDTNLPGDPGPGVNQDDYQYVISPGNFNDRAPGAFRFRGNSQGVMSDFSGSQASVAAVRTADGYHLEAAIPWSDLSLQPQGGLVLGAAFSINDLDTPGTAVQELMLSNVPGRQWADPRSWGRLELVP